MNIILYISIVMCVVGIAVGQLLFKKAATFHNEHTGLIAIALNYWLLAALTIYGVATLAWIWTLKQVPLYVAYPFMGLAFVIVPVLAHFFLDEPITWKTVIGGLLILGGIVLSSSSTGN